jgi:Flp pilus assembly secretin CpaC
LTRIGSAQLEQALRNRKRKSIGGISMIAILRAFVLLLALFPATISASRAADRSIDLRVGFRSSLVLDRAYETVLIGDSDVVDVHMRDDRSVVLEPLAPGATNLVFLDDQNIVIANFDILVRQSTVNLVGKFPWAR